MQTYQNIRFDQHIFHGRTADGEQYDHEADPDHDYNYSASDDQYFSWIREEDMDSIINQLKHGWKVDNDFSFRLTEHESDINLLKVVIEHAGYVLDGYSDWFCFGIWHQKFDFRNHEVANLLLELYFKSGGDLLHFSGGCVEDSLTWNEDGEIPELTDWLETEYRKFIAKYGLFKWKVSSKDNNFEADAPVAGMVALIRDALKTLTGHEAMEVWEDKDGYRINFQDCEEWPKATERWDWHRYTDGKSLEDVCEVFDNLLDYAYSGDEKFSIERI
ncbi:hypothetical protein [Paraburkholderia fungorum]|uniref:hypothetical protein n=1 Tax=Paraburkholderia fungorum TaxID=134537 RepID=UPI000D061662|nr:hypothetical protein [Paraburkholderia fungorum]PRZ48168.1 hypothetical protein BX589_128124 [Paraburkholderia fungorum]